MKEEVILVDWFEEETEANLQKNHSELENFWTKHRYLAQTLLTPSLMLS
jgi:hypothetical protein